MSWHTYKKLNKEDTNDMCLDMLIKNYERYYIYNIFTTNHGWLVIIGSNLNLALRLLF